MKSATSSNPAAQAKLADRSWRWINSLWILPPILSFGLLAPLGFLIAAIRTGQRKYWVSCTAYSVLLALVFALASAGDKYSGLMASLLFGTLIASTVHAIAWNRSYLTALASQQKWYEAAATSAAQTPAPQGSEQFGVSQDEFYAPTVGTAPSAPRNPMPPPVPPQPAPIRPAWPSSESDPIDINTVTFDGLSGARIDPVLARRLIDVRDSRGGFRDFADLVATVNLKPHEAARINGMFVFGPSNSAPLGRGESGRILDI